MYGGLWLSKQFKIVRGKPDLCLETKDTLEIVQFETQFTTILNVFETDENREDFLAVNLEDKSECYGIISNAELITKCLISFNDHSAYKQGQLAV